MKTKNSSTKIDISGLSKAAVLAGLYNSAKPLGLGFLNSTFKDMTIEEAQSIIDSSYNLKFDYVKGRPLKVNLSHDIIDVSYYDEIQGEGRGFQVIKNVMNNILKGDSANIQPKDDIEKFALDYRAGKFGDQSFDQAMSDAGIDSGITIVPLGQDNDNSDSN